MSMITERAASVPSASYDLAMRLLGAAWFFLLALLMGVRLGAMPEAEWASHLSSLLLGMFYLLLAYLMLVRLPAKAQAEGFAPKMAAFVGSYLPWAVSLFGQTDAMLPNLAATACILFGAVMMLITIRHLGSAFSLVPQARKVVQSGPYRWVKHPLYLFEEITVVGVVLKSFTIPAALLLVVHIGLQVWRIRYEEDVLRRTFPEYAEYEASRWRLIPYVW